MEKVRIGNTIALSWEIFITENGKTLPYDLSGKNISVYLVNAFGRVKIDKFFVEGNLLSFSWEGSEQKHAGVYQMTLIENEGESSMHTLDKCDAFELVRCSCFEEDDDNDIVKDVELSSTLDLTRIYPIIPQIGENGNWWVDGKDTGKPSRGEKGEGGGGTIDPETIEGFVPLMRDFSDDFNNDFSR